ncbi:hypothetical protein GIB67_040155 [Kingdonia uniflora]|uniref:DPL2-like protein n=1 Tax=Kingdonia uniflora TaxID=39325 RepID=A0A7J7MUN2_9MAGN|nr:hypothetical protein GIB67_040155 [Kingdonia uniflora]
MGSEEPKDVLKGVDWKAVSGGDEFSNNGVSTSTSTSTSGSPVIKKRLPRKLRQIPEYYFLPRRSLPVTMAIYGSCIAAGIGAGMVVEVWTKKKIEEDGGVVWELKK